jgi:hypothetical protein
LPGLPTGDQAIVTAEALPAPKATSIVASAAATKADVFVFFKGCPFRVRDIKRQSKGVCQQSRGNGSQDYDLGTAGKKTSSNAKKCGGVAAFSRRGKRTSWWRIGFAFKEAVSLQAATIAWIVSEIKIFLPPSPEHFLDIRKKMLSERQLGSCHRI